MISWWSHDSIKKRKKNIESISATHATNKCTHLYIYVRINSNDVNVVVTANRQFQEAKKIRSMDLELVFNSQRNKNHCDSFIVGNIYIPGCSIFAIYFSRNKENILSFLLQDGFAGCVFFCALLHVRSLHLVFAYAFWAFQFTFSKCSTDARRTSFFLFLFGHFNRAQLE